MAPLAVADGRDLEEPTLPTRTRTFLSVLSAALVGSLVLVGAAPGHADIYQRSNDAHITISDQSVRTRALDVNGVGGVITDVNVTIHNFGHQWPDDIDLMVVGPDGTRVVLMSDACGGGTMEDHDWSFDDEAGTFLRDGVSSPYGDCSTAAVQPTAYEADTDAWPAGLPPTTTLSSFDGINPNGRWRLIVIDDQRSFVGDIEDGWSLRLSTGSFRMRLPSGRTGVGPASKYPFTKSVSGRSGMISDVDVRIEGIWHRRPDDLDVLLVGPRGQKVMLMSDACGSNEATGFQYTFNDENTERLRDEKTCFASDVKPANFQTGDTMPGPAPSGPYAAKLSAFDGTNPNGTWRVYIADDRANESGFLTAAPVINIRTAG